MMAGYTARSHHFAELGTPSDRAAKERFLEEAGVRWRRLLADGALTQPEQFAPGVWVEAHHGSWVVRWDDLARRPWAESVARSAPAGSLVAVGLPGQGWQLASEWVLRTHGVDLTTCEVRVGVTRGHLLALVFSVPLDVPGGPDALQAAVESLCERALGEQLLDRWVVSIDVVRSARRSKLAVLSETAFGAETHPLHLLEQLVDIGVSAVLAQLPESRLDAPPEGWTALELEPTGAGLQGDRLQAFTNVPEALKAALEGLPFDSARFTRGAEVMIWLAWTGRSLERRVAARETAEALITEVSGQPRAVGLCGSGFGASNDYLDLWAIPEVEVLATIRAELASRLGTAVTLGFYDSHWSSEHLGPWLGTAP